MSRENEAKRNIDHTLNSLVEDGAQSKEISLAIISQCLIDISKNLAYLCDLLDKEGGMQE